MPARKRKHASALQRGGPTRAAALPFTARIGRISMTSRQRILILAAAAMTAIVLWLALGRGTRAAENELAGNGTVEATEIEVGAQRQARLVRILVKEGDRVKRGQLLVVLASGELKAQEQQARGAVGAARAPLLDGESRARSA